MTMNQSETVENFNPDQHAVTEFRIPPFSTTWPTDGKQSKIIHQMGPSDKTLWDPKWAKCQLSWKTMYHDYEYKYWTDDLIDTFMKTNYPEFYNSVFIKYPKKIQRIDASRYFILYTYGGLYADMDVECLKRFDNMLQDGCVNIAASPFKWEVYQNALMWVGAPKHPFWVYVFEALTIHKDIVNVLDSTGPRLIDYVVDKAPKEMFNKLSAHMFTDPGVYTRHMHTYSWRDEDTNSASILPGQT